MFKLNQKSKDKAALSLPKSKTVCGYEIKKLPIGGYLKALEKVKNLPSDFLEQCFPGKTFSEILDIFSKLDTQSFVSMASVVFLTAPGYIVGFVSELTEIPEESLLNDENIGLDGFTEIVIAFLEVNELGKLISGAGEIKTKAQELLKAQTQVTGSSN